MIKEGLPMGAFAIAEDSENPDTWRLPHHNRNIYRMLKGKIDVERTVDWDRMKSAVAALSPGDHRRQRVDASPEQVLKAAGHLADHYRKAGKPLPDILAALS
jgi:hypothetical protein